MVRGEIYFADTSPRSGSELRGLRPYVVVSDNIYTSSNRWGTVTVVPCSSAERWLVPSATRVQFEAGECGLPKRCAALPLQITTLDKSKIKGGPIGRLTPEKQEALDEAIRAYLSL